MSLIALAEQIDRLVEDGRAFVAESPDAAIVSNVSAAHIDLLLALCSPLGWKTQLFDRAGELWEEETLDADFQPFRLVIQKPASADDSIQLLTNHAFAQWLLGEHLAAKLQVARLECSLIAGTRVICAWGGNQSGATSAATKSPRTLVKEFGNKRKVPDDVRAWLTSAPAPEHFNHPTTQVWVRAASAALISCLPDEMDAENGELKFRGPPRLALPTFDGAVDPLDCNTYSALLAAVAWVFESEREAEVRHILLAGELARSGSAAQSTTIFLKNNLHHAWESAKLAYQMAVAETGRDTLKVLSDLRKAVTEETAKLSDMGRQLTGAVAAAIATGIGLIAARVATNAPAVLIALVMGVVALYVATVIVSGLQFMSLQRQLRVDWQHRLYRFLPPNDYQQMVVKPTRSAERAFAWTAGLGGMAVVLLTMICVWLTLTHESHEPEAKEPKTSISAVKKSSDAENGKAAVELLKDDTRRAPQEAPPTTVTPIAVSAPAAVAASTPPPKNPP